MNVFYLVKMCIILEVKLNKLIEPIQYWWEQNCKKQSLVSWWLCVGLWIWRLSTQL